ncbi:forespore capture DNA-binding protein RefZ [Bacillus benzoevorans]|uniref:AcrR family transcriptional regulator n=1 Tax=Bacillus benzoevorans TaxID=1456 RepID=A0A7X0HRT4_9BACI|nr:AcrR family transcriptional regulator [Bacillus benzoevorans]
MRRNAKDEIAAAAIFLFNTNGFNGTTIRDIAKKAKVNIANISYYFQNKNGLLEYCFTIYFERYMAEIEKGLGELEKGARHCMKNIIKNLLVFHCENIPLSRFVLREISLDSQMVREIMSTYLVKERYYLTRILEYGVEKQEYKKLNGNYFIIQLKGMLSMPFINSHYISEVLHIFPHEKHFLDKYLGALHQWIDSTLSSPLWKNESYALL